MKSTGIVRRIDELGRIVIPKEIRKNLKIKDNDFLEVYIDQNDIILKKFSNMNEMEKNFNNYINILKNITGNNIIITDKEKIVSTTYKNEEILNEEISSFLDEIIKNRSTVLSNDIKEICLTNNVLLNSNYYIIPLIINSDISGLIIMLSNRKLSDLDKLSLEIVSKIIVNYIE